MTRYWTVAKKRYHIIDLDIEGQPSLSGMLIPLKIPVFGKVKCDTKIKYASCIQKAYNIIIVRHSCLLDGTGCEIDSWQCRIYIISHVHKANDHLVPFGVLWVHMTWNKNCVKIYIFMHDLEYEGQPSRSSDLFWNVKEFQFSAI